MRGIKHTGGIQTYGRIQVYAPPVCLDAPVFGQPPVSLGTPMFGCLLYVWTLPYIHMFGCPCVCLQDVWMSTVHIEQKETMLCQTEGVSICPPYIWMPSVSLDTPICLDVPHTFGCPIYLGGIQTYRGQPNKWRTSKHTVGVQTCGGI